MGRSDIPRSQKVTRMQARNNGLLYYQGLPCLYGHPGKRRVSDAHCVDCGSRKYQLYYNKHKEEILARSAAYDQANPEQHRERIRRWKNKEPGRKARQSKRHRELNPDKTQARELLKAAVRKGWIIKQPCAICGALMVEAHHQDYSKPLEITWLCPPHHYDLHGRRR